MTKQKVLILVDESNATSSARFAGRRIDWLKLRDHLVGDYEVRQLMEMVIYVGLPPQQPEWQQQRDSKLRWLHWLKTQGFLVVQKDGKTDGDWYKANLDVLMAIDAVALAVECRPDIVVLVTGDGDFSHLALTLRRKGIRVEVASLVPQTFAAELGAAANEVIDLTYLLDEFEALTGKYDQPGEVID